VAVSGIRLVPESLSFVRSKDEQGSSRVIVRRDGGKASISDIDVNT